MKGVDDSPVIAGIAKGAERRLLLLCFFYEMLNKNVRKIDLAQSGLFVPRDYCW